MSCYSEKWFILFCAQYCGVLHGFSFFYYGHFDGRIWCHMGLCLIFYVSLFAYVVWKWWVMWLLVVLSDLLLWVKLKLRLPSTITLLVTYINLNISFFFCTIEKYGYTHINKLRIILSYHNIHKWIFTYKLALVLGKKVFWPNIPVRIYEMGKSFMLP